MNGADDWDDKEEESQTLKTLLGDSTTNGAGVKSFFATIYQDQCVEFRWENRHRLSGKSSSEASGNDCSDFHASDFWNDDSIKANPYEEIVNQRYPTLVHLLQGASTSSQVEEDEHTAPILFKDQANVTNELLESSYHNSLFAAYLDGCSIVLNHADLTSPWIAALCQDLQKSFPHAYANVYITPPGSQAVSAHADDRDVIVIQVGGQKDWKIYSKVPIPYPYPCEQVGKGDLAVPEEVLKGPTLIETTLSAGDAVYMPRGYVHEARASEKDFSFHVTIALATHDWTLAGILTNATEKILHNVLDYRKAIHRKFGVQDLKDIPVKEQDHLQTQIQEAFQLLQQQVTVQQVTSNLSHKFHRHNHRAFSARMKIMHEMRFPAESPTADGDNSPPIVGPQAAKIVSLNSFVRAATNAEKESVMMDQPRGLRVRESVADAIVQILTVLKTVPNKDGIAVKDLKSLIKPETTPNTELICPLTLLSFVKVCIEQGALAVVRR